LYSILFLAIASFVLCLVLTPLVQTWFQRWGLVDWPGEGHRRHSSPVPRVGGIAIALSYLAAVTLLLLSPLHGAETVKLPLVWYLMPSAAVVFTTGLLDDLKGLKPWQKLIGQAGAAVLAWFAGIRVLGVAGFSAHGWWSLSLTVLWLVACANAFNLIDGVDGLAAGVSLFATLTIFVAALLQYNTPLALSTAPLAGALLAFLRYNFTPASIFLGDCGSLSIGFLLGCYSVIWSQKSATLLGLTAPLMALSIPLLDTVLSVGRRFLRHQPIFGSDRNHIHHRLLDRGFSPRQVALVLYGVCGVAAVLSLLQSALHNQFGGLIVVIFCMAMWIGVKVLGYGEFDAARRLAWQGSFRHIVHAQLYMVNFEKKLKEAMTRGDCWLAIREAGLHFGFAPVRMCLGGESFEEGPDTAGRAGCCTMRIPLSDKEYVNFTHYSEFSVKHSVAMTAFVDVLRRALVSRIEDFQAPAAPNGISDLHRSNGPISGSLAESVSTARY
jgi:UDP-GlcNAc:undecaprenyl-phosphate GlcNAc-1-phosphate transferase